MTSATRCEIKDWYESICSRMDVLAQAASDEYYEEDGDYKPSEKALDAAKSFLREMGESGTHVPAKQPTIWFGPDGVVGLSWRWKKDNVPFKLEFIFNENGFEQMLKNSKVEAYDGPLAVSQIILAEVA